MSISRQADRRDVGARAAAEQAVLATMPLLRGDAGVGKDGFRCSENCGAVRRYGVECAGCSKAFKLAPVELPRIDALREIFERGERSALLSLGDQSLHRFFADALERAEGIADGLTLDREVGPAAVDVRRQAVDLSSADVLNEQCQFISLGHVEAHRRGVKFGAVMGLQPSGMIGD